MARERTWRTVVGFEGYEVSSDGLVRSKPKVVDYEQQGRTRRREFPAKVLRLNTDKHGYKRVRIGSRTSGRATLHVHRMVCEAFHGPSPAGKVMVAHNDGDRGNNLAENVRWATAQENADDMLTHGTRMGLDEHPRAKLTSPDVKVARALRAEGHTIPSLAQKFGVSTSTIYAAITGKTWGDVK